MLVPFSPALTDSNAARLVPVSRTEGQKRSRSESASMSQNKRITTKAECYLGQLCSKVYRSIFIYLESTELAVLGSVNRRVHLNVGKSPFYAKILTDSGIALPAHKRFYAAAVHQAIEQGHTDCISSMAKVLYLERVTAQKAKYVISLMQRAIANTTHPKHSNLLFARDSILINYHAKGFCVTESDAAMESKLKACIEKLKNQSQAEAALAIFRSSIRGFCSNSFYPYAYKLAGNFRQSRSDQNSKLGEIVQDLLAAFAAPTSEARHQAYLKWKAHLTDPAAAGALKFFDLRDFLSLLDVQHLVDVDTSEVARLELSRLAFRSPDAYIAELAVLQLAKAQLAKAANPSHDAAFCDYLSDVANSTLWRPAMCNQALYGLASFSLENRAPEKFKMIDQHIAGLAGQWRVALPVITDRGMAFKPSLQWAEYALVKLQLEERVDVISSEVALKIIEKRLPFTHTDAPEGRFFRYAKLHFRFKSLESAPKGSRKLHRELMQDLMHCVNVETDPQLRQKINLLMIKMHVNGFSLKKFTSDKMIFVMGHNIYSNTRNSFSMRSDALLAISKIYSSKAVDVSLEQTDLLFKLLRELINSNQSTSEQKNEARLFLVKFYFESDFQRRVLRDEAIVYGQDIVNDVQASSHHRHVAFACLSNLLATK